MREIRSPNDERCFAHAFSAFFNQFSHLRLHRFIHFNQRRPRAFEGFAGEFLRRVEVGKLADEELYPSDAQWSGLYDRMHTHEPGEIEWRLALAADYGEAV